MHHGRRRGARTTRDETRWGSLVRTAFLLTGDHGHAEDLVQSTLTRTYLRWDRLRSTRRTTESYHAHVHAAASPMRWGRRHWRGELPYPRSSPTNQNTTRRRT